MTKYDDHMIRAATLRTNGNYVKARMHEEHAQYNYGFGMKMPFNMRNPFKGPSKYKAPLPDPNIIEPKSEKGQKALDNQRINEEFWKLETEIQEEISEFIGKHCPSMTEPLGIVDVMQKENFAHINRAKAYFLLKTDYENVLRKMGMNVHLQHFEQTEQTKVKIEFLRKPDEFLPLFYHLLKPDLKQYSVRISPSTSSQNPSTLPLTFEYKQKTKREEIRERIGYQLGIDIDEPSKELTIDKKASEHNAKSSRQDMTPEELEAHNATLKAEQNVLHEKNDAAAKAAAKVYPHYPDRNESVSYQGELEKMARHDREVRRMRREGI